MRTIDIKEKDGTITEYIIDHNRVIKQLYPKRFVYDARYVSTYDTPDYERKSVALQTLRSGFIQATAPFEVKSLLDVGYGNGAFLKTAKQSFGDCRGFDITGLPVPSGCEKAASIYGGAYDSDVVTFWDCLEHFPDLSFVAGLCTKMVVISLPWSHWWDIPASETRSWFTTWKHRKANEHLHHFDEISLRDTMKMYKWKMIAHTNIEDAIRKGPDKRKNILTAAFIRS